MGRFYAFSILLYVFSLHAFAAEPGWTGFYAGLSAGSYQGKSLPDNFATTDTSSTFDGALFGVQAGYLWQNGPWLLGAELDLSKPFGTERQSLTDVIIPGLLTINAHADRQQDWLATARLRAGVLIHPNVMLFASGGLASARIDTDLFISQTIFCGCGDVVIPLVEGVANELKFGGVAGFGAELALSSALRVKIEYLHYDLGRSEMNVVNYPGPVTSLSTYENKADIVRFGVNFTLGGSVP